MPILIALVVITADVPFFFLIAGGVFSFFFGLTALTGSMAIFVDLCQWLAGFVVQHPDRLRGFIIGTIWFVCGLIATLIAVLRDK